MQKMTPKEFFELLYKIQDRPGLFIGTKSLTRLKSYLDGFLDGMCYYMVDTDEGKNPNFLKGFQEWIQIKYDITSSHNWSSILNFFTQNEEDAFDLFYKELNEFMSLPQDIRDFQNIEKLSKRWMEYKSEYWEKYHELRDECMNVEDK